MGVGLFFVVRVLLTDPWYSYPPVSFVLRKYATFLLRFCIILIAKHILNSTNQDVVLPLSTPVKGLDGREITEVPIPNNTYVIIGILACNRNPEIWGPDSYEWKPERWLNPLPASVSAARIPGVYSNLSVELIVLSKNRFDS